jgi:hypothetical protein
LSIFGASNQYADSSLTSSTTYQYRCRAVDTTERASEYSYSGGTTSAGAANQAPVWQSPINLSLQQGSSVSIAGYASDPEGDQLTFAKVSSSPSAANIVLVSGPGVLSCTAACPVDVYTLTVSANDGALSTNGTITLTVTAASTGTNFDITTGTSNYDAAAAGVQPGDTITILRGSGTRSPLLIRNVAGTLAAPITIRGDTNGVVTIRRAAPVGGGFVFELRNCHHFVLDGYRASATKGCGIKVTYATSAGATKDNPSAFVQFSGNPYTASSGLTPSDDFTCRYIEVAGGWPTYAVGSCIGIQINQSGYLAANFPGQYIENCIFEHNYVHDCHGEGMYLGPNAYDLRVPLRNITVRYNWCQGMGREGMQCKSWFSGTNAVYGNTVIGNGLSGDTADCTGISMLSSVADVHDNWVQDSGHNGINFYTDRFPPATDYPSFTCNVYNNVVINAGVLGTGNDEGIVANASSTAGMTDLIVHIYSNTVVDCNGNGIQIATNAGAGWVRNNISLGNGTAISINGASSQTGNLTGTAPATYLNADYTLKAAYAVTGGSYAPYTSEASPTGTSAINQAARSSPDVGAYDF